jgi:hypothetical protein
MDEGGAVVITPRFHLAWSLRLRDHRHFARQTPESEVWLARLDTIDRWLDAPAQLAARLVDLLVASKQLEGEAMDRVVAAIEAGGHDELHARRSMMASELVCTASRLMVMLGPPAREVLLRAFEAAGTGSTERWWFLRTLSEMGDVSLEPFFNALKEGDVVWDGPSEPVQHFRSNFEYWCARNAFEVGGVEAVYAAVAHPREGWRWAAVSELVRIGDYRAVTALQGMLSDPADTIRTSARHALEWVGRKHLGI